MSLKSKLNLIGTTLGGYPEVKDLMSAEDIRKIVNFPGEIVVTSTASIVNQIQDIEDIDLTVLGYLPQTPYNVLDSSFKYLYTGSSNQWFGETQADINFGYSLKHSNYFYITFSTIERRSKAVLIWVQSRLSKQDSAQVLKSISANSKILSQAQIKQINSEVFIYSDLYAEQLTVYIIPGEIYDQPSIASILKSALKRAFRFKSRNGQLFKNLADNWLLVTSQLLNSDGTLDKLLIWPLAQPEGYGDERIFRKQRGTTFVSSTSLSRVNLTEEKQPYLTSSLRVQIKLGNVPFFVSNQALLNLGIILTPDQNPNNEIEYDPDLDISNGLEEVLTLEVYGNAQDEIASTQLKTFAYPNSRSANDLLVYGTNTVTYEDVTAHEANGTINQNNSKAAETNSSITNDANTDVSGQPESTN